MLAQTMRFLSTSLSSMLKQVLIRATCLVLSIPMYLAQASTSSCRKALMSLGSKLDISCIIAPSALYKPELLNLLSVLHCLLSWLSMNYMALIRATAFHVCLQTESVTVRVFVGEFLALSTMFYLTHCYIPFHSRFNISGNSSYIPSINSWKYSQDCHGVSNVHKLSHIQSSHIFSPL